MRVLGRILHRAAAAFASTDSSQGESVSQTVSPCSGSSQGETSSICPEVTLVVVEPTMRKVLAQSLAVGCVLFAQERTFLSRRSSMALMKGGTSIFFPSCTLRIDFFASSNKVS